VAAKLNLTFLPFSYRKTISLTIDYAGLSLAVTTTSFLDAAYHCFAMDGQQQSCVAVKIEPYSHGKFYCSFHLDMQKHPQYCGDALGRRQTQLRRY
jgi:hypothetical protein